MPHIAIQWTAGFAGTNPLGDYTLQRSVSGEAGPFTTIATFTQEDSREYMDEDIEPGSTYHYRVKVVDEDGSNSVPEWSNIISVSVPGSADTAFIFTAAPDDSRIGVSYEVPFITAYGTVVQEYEFPGTDEVKSVYSQNFRVRIAVIGPNVTSNMAELASLIDIYDDDTNTLIATFEPSGSEGFTAIFDEGSTYVGGLFDFLLVAAVFLPGGIVEHLFEDGVTYRLEFTLP